MRFANFAAALVERDVRRWRGDGQPHRIAHRYVAAGRDAVLQFVVAQFVGTQVQVGTLDFHLTAGNQFAKTLAVNALGQQRGRRFGRRRGGFGGGFGGFGRGDCFVGIDGFCLDGNRLRAFRVFCVFRDGNGFFGRRCAAGSERLRLGRADEVGRGLCGQRRFGCVVFGRGFGGCGFGGRVDAVAADFHVAEENRFALPLPLYAHAFLPGVAFGAGGQRCERCQPYRQCCPINQTANVPLLPQNCCPHTVQVRRRHFRADFRR